MEYWKNTAICRNAVATLVVAAVAVAMMLPFRPSLAAGIHVVGTTFGIRSVIGPDAKHKEAGDILRCMLAPLGEETAYVGHSRDRILVLRDTEQIDAIFPSGKFSSWTNHETLWIGPTHHIELSWVKLVKDTETALFPAEVRKSAHIGVERGSYAEKWLAMQGYSNRTRHTTNDELYAGLLHGHFQYIFTLSRNSSAFDSGVFQRANFAEKTAAKIPVGITFTKSFVDSHTDFAIDLEDRLHACQASLDNALDR